MGENILSIENLHVVYENFDTTTYAVNGINLELEKGKTLGLVGETGAGKTTTAYSILRILAKDIGRISEGKITFDGTDITNASEEEMRKIRGSKISIIFQDPMTALNPVMTVGEQIAEVLEVHGIKDKNEINQKVEEMLEFVGIPKERKNDYPHQFSGGMKQRIVIAIALTCEPELLIADEPTTALDVTIQAQVLKLMTDLRDKLGMSMIFITHDLGLIAKMCDEVAIIYAGEIIEKGTTEQIFKDFKHPYTRGLFGSIPSLTTKVKRLNPIEGLMPDPANLPSGCKFNPRCKFATDLCRKESPAEKMVDGHVVRCHLFDKEI